MIKPCIPLIFLILVACSSENDMTETTTQTVEAQKILEQTPAPLAVQGDIETLDAVLLSQEQDIKDRYSYRNPKETLAFFGVQPGDTVLEVLPGRGWYSKILLPYLGSEGELLVAFYPKAIWPMFGFLDAEGIAERQKQVENWPATAEAWRKAGSAPLGEAFEFGLFPQASKGKADSVLFIRALHNLNRFENTGFREAALKDAYDALKSGGRVGVVQHRAPESHSDEWASGSAGYLKQATVISWFEEAGFTLVETSEINANPKDQPSEDDLVWRLPPTLMASGDDPEIKAKHLAIGESDRMTLKFVKP